jgi:hypothetical protein
MFNSHVGVKSLTSSFGHCWVFRLPVRIGYVGSETMRGMKVLCLCISMGLMKGYVPISAAICRRNVDVNKAIILMLYKIIY